MFDQHIFFHGQMPLLQQALHDLISSSNLPEGFTIADFGCSSRPHPLIVVSEITSFVYKRCQELGRSPPEFWVYLNEFPGYDFNTVFKSLPDYHEKLQEENGPDFKPSLYISGVPGPSHERLFPSKSLHFVHSSSTLNWLSQVPPELSDRENTLINKGKICISKTSPPEVIRAYRTQFQSDFASFLESRSKEVVPGGRMVLTLIGRTTPDPAADDQSCLLWDYLAQALQDLVEKGLIEEEKLDTYNIPYYEPYTEEIKAEIEKQGSFKLDHLVINLIPWCGTKNGPGKKDHERATTTAHMIVNTMRVVHEPTILSHFGSEIVDSLFQKFIEAIAAAETKEVEHVGIAVCVTKK